MLEELRLDNARMVKEIREFGQRIFGASLVRGCSVQPAVRVANVGKVHSESSIALQTVPTRAGGHLHNLKS